MGMFGTIGTTSSVPLNSEYMYISWVCLIQYTNVTVGLLKISDCNSGLTGLISEFPG